MAVHLGTLLAVVVYFWRDLMSLLFGCFQTLSGEPNQEGNLAINLIVASLPIVFVGLLIKSFVENELRSAAVITITTIVFGVLLYAADRWSRRHRETSELTMTHAAMIGAAQCLALIPGTSRSGVTITAALALGYQREAASRISFLLSIPTILGASLLLLLDLLRSSHAVDWDTLAIGMVVSGITAYLCIQLFLSFIEKIGFLPFVIYRLALGLALGFIVWT